jgi:prefoldin subunit 5
MTESNKGIQRQLDKVFAHIEVYNREMGCVQSDVGTLKRDIGEIKVTLISLEEKIDKAINQLPNWATVLIGILMASIGWLLAH